MEAKSTEIPSDPQKDLISIISYPAITLPTSYHNVIIARWLRSLRHLNDYFRLIDKKAYFETYEKYIKNILTRPNAFIKLAVLANDTDVVFGWSVNEKTTLHYVHVQELYRSRGIGSMLIPKETTNCSHITKHWLEIWPKKYQKVTFNPFI